MKKSLLAILALIVPAVLVIFTIEEVNKTWFTVVGVLCFALMVLMTVARIQQKNLKDSYLFALAFRWNAMLTLCICALASWPCVDNNGLFFLALGCVYTCLSYTICAHIFPETEKLLESYEKQEKKEESDN